MKTDDNDTVNAATSSKGREIVAPSSVLLKGVKYYSTGKTGTRNRDGVTVAEYEGPKASRMWLGTDGVVEMDN